jgi:hypothetical protein
MEYSDADISSLMALSPGQSMYGYSGTPQAAARQATDAETQRLGRLASERFNKSWLNSPVAPALVMMGGAALGGAFGGIGSGAPAAPGVAPSSAAGGGGGGTLAGMGGGGLSGSALGGAGGELGASSLAPGLDLGGAAASGASGGGSFLDRFMRFKPSMGGGSQQSGPQTMPFVDRMPSAPAFLPIHRPKSRQQLLAESLEASNREYS